MCLSRCSRHMSRLLAVSLLGLMVLSPANAQTSSESEGRELGAFALGAGTINPGTPETGPHAANPTSESEGRELGAFALGAGTINPGTPETGPHAASPTPETNEKV